MSKKPIGFSESELKKFHTLNEKRIAVNREIAYHDNVVIASSSAISALNKELVVIDTKMNQMMKTEGNQI